MHIDLAGKVALVSGASRGIGRAIALELAAAGAAVVVNYRSGAAGAEALVQAIVDAGGHAVAAQGDVADRAAGEQLVKTATDTYGRLDILINNAGVTRDNLLFA